MEVASDPPVAATDLHPLSPQTRSAAAGSVRLTTTIPPHIEQGLREIAQNDELPVSAVVRRALSTYIKIRNREVAS